LKCSFHPQQVGENPQSGQSNARITGHALKCSFHPQQVGENPQSGQSNARITGSSQRAKRLNQQQPHMVQSLINSTPGSMPINC